MSKEWYAKNKDRAKEYTRMWRKANPDKDKETHRKWRMANRDRIAEYQRKWYLANRDRMAKLHQQYMTKHPLHNTWKNMLCRTGIKPGASAKDIKNYFQRGITVCTEWQTYINFESWAFAHGWKPGLELDRIDVNGNYEPNNCRLVPHSRNQINKRCTVFVVYNGTRMSLADAYKAAGCRLSLRLVRDRIRQKWPIEKALTVPVG